MDNPIKAMRLARGLNRKELAASLETSYAQIASAEGGNPREIPLRWERGLRALGIDYHQLNEQYRQWRIATLAVAASPRQS